MFENVMVNFRNFDFPFRNFDFSLSKIRLKPYSPWLTNQRGSPAATEPGWRARTADRRAYRRAGGC